MEEAKAYADRTVHARFDAHYAKRVNARKLVELEALLTRLVPPTHELYGRLFAERVICEQYKHAQQMQKPTAPATEYL